MKGASRAGALAAGRGALGGLALVGLAFLACGMPPAERAAGAPLRVVASVPPLAWLAERLGGERVAVTVLLPPGGDPHAWEPSPRRAAALETADLFFAVGHPSLPFEERLLGRPGRGAGGAADEVRVVRMSEAAADGGDLGPHPWLAPSAMAAAARELAAALAALDPAGADGYRERLAAVEAEIAAADRALRTALGGPNDGPGGRGAGFVVHHPSWDALAGEYGLEQIAIEDEGKEPGPRRLVALVERARAAGVRAVLVDTPAVPQSARTVAAELGVPVVVVDPLGHDWPATLRTAGEALGEPGETGGDDA